MSDSAVRSFTIPEELDEYMRECDDVNWSAVVRDFLREYSTSGQTVEAAMSVRLKEVEREIAELEEELERKKDERDRLRDSLHERKEARRDMFESFADLDIPSHALTVDNAAVQNYAEKNNMAPEEFLAEYREWCA